MEAIIDNDCINEISQVLKQNKDKRICVVGTTCTGKSTYLKYFDNGLDMDEIIFPLLSEKEKEYVCQTPWTEEIGRTMERLVKERIKIQPMHPVFGTVIIDCDLIIYLDISDDLLRQRTDSRNASYDDAKNMKFRIEKELSEINIPIVTIRINSLCVN